MQASKVQSRPPEYRMAIFAVTGTCPGGFGIFLIRRTKAFRRFSNRASIAGEVRFSLGISELGNSGLLRV